MFMYRLFKKGKYFIYAIKNLECFTLVIIRIHEYGKVYDNDRKTSAIMLERYSAGTQNDFAILDMPFHSTWLTVNLFYVLIVS